MRSILIPIIGFIVLLALAVRNRDINSSQAEKILGGYLVVIIAACLTRSMLVFALGSIAMMIPILYHMGAFGKRIR